MASPLGCLQQVTVWGSISSGLLSHMGRICLCRMPRASPAREDACSSSHLGIWPSWGPRAAQRRHWDGKMERTFLAACLAGYPGTALSFLLLFLEIRSKAVAAKLSFLTRWLQSSSQWNVRGEEEARASVRDSRTSSWPLPFLSHENRSSCCFDVLASGCLSLGLTIIKIRSSSTERRGG